ncbi:MAG: hypothetical protein NVS2B17_07000 [Candidatus Velthaea sp.]
MRYDMRKEANMRAVAHIPQIAPPVTTEDLLNQVILLREVVAHLQERIEIMESRDTLRGAGVKLP